VRGHIGIVEKTVVIQGLLKFFHGKDVKAGPHDLGGKLVNATEHRPLLLLAVLIPIDYLVVEAFTAAANFIAKRGGGTDTNAGGFDKIHVANCTVQAMPDLVFRGYFE